MPSISNPELFALWLDNQLNDQQREEFESRCLNDLDFAKQVETAKSFSFQAQEYQEQSVPKWSPEHVFPSEKIVPWYRGVGLNLVSTGCSIFAILMVLTGTHVKIEQGAVSFHFGEEGQKKLVAQVVTDALAKQAEVQQANFSIYLEAMQKQQTLANTELTQYLLTASRQERREDLDTFIQFINQQRADDQKFYNRQLIALQQDVSLATNTAWAEPTDYQINE